MYTKAAQIAESMEGEECELHSAIIGLLDASVGLLVTGTDSGCSAKQVERILKRIEDLFDRVKSSQTQFWAGQRHEFGRTCLRHAESIRDKAWGKLRRYLEHVGERFLSTAVV